MNKHGVIRCLKDGYLEEARALGEEGRSGGEADRGRGQQVHTGGTDSAVKSL